MRTIFKVFSVAKNGLRLESVSLRYLLKIKIFSLSEIES